MKDKEEILLWLRQQKNYGFKRIEEIENGRHVLTHEDKKRVIHNELIRIDTLNYIIDTLEFSN